MSNEMRAVRSTQLRTNPWRKAAHVIALPLMLVEWLLDLIGKIVEVTRKSFEILTLAVIKYINEPVREKSTD